MKPRTYIDKKPATPQLLEVEGVLVYGYRSAPAPIQETVHAHTVEGFDLYVKSRRRRPLGDQRCTQARYRLILTPLGQEVLTPQQTADLKVGYYTDI